MAGDSPVEGESSGTNPSVDTTGAGGFNFGQGGSSTFNFGGNTGQEDRSQGQHGGRNAADAEINSANLKLPDFWITHAKAWFRNAEGNFYTRRITNETTMYYHVIRSLTAKAVQELDDILEDDSLKTDYQSLKEKIIGRFASTTEEKLRELVGTQSLGDRTPSQFLRHLRSLAEKNVTEKVLGTLWSDKLPMQVQAVIASQLKTQPLDQVAELADELCKMINNNPGFGVNAATAPSAAPAATAAAAAPPDKLDLVLQRLELMEARISDMDDRGRNRDRQQGGPERGRDSSRRRGDSRQRSRERPAGHPHCYYHYNYGAQARNCKAPCSFYAASTGAEN